jgi:hypothetical protein
MSKIYPEILDSKRLAIFKKIGKIEKDSYLLGGTALALQIRHRKSIDFDLALNQPIKKALLRKVTEAFPDYNISVSIDQPSELTFFLNGDIKVTFLHYPFPNLHPFIKTEFMNLLSLPDLASTKAQTIGRRGEWKDYVDLFFLLTKTKLDIGDIIKDAKKIFDGEFSDKLFLEQLVYWDDITDFDIDFIGGNISKSEIQNYLSKLVRKILGT